MEMQKLMESIQSQDANRVSEVLDQAPALIHVQTTWGVPVLQFAAYVGAKSVVPLLIERGAKMDVFSAAALNDASSVKSFVESDPATIHSYSTDGWTALHLAGYMGSPEAARALLAAGAPLEVRSRNDNSNSPLHAAAAGNKAALVELLLEAGADVNATYEGGNSPLHEAAFNGNVPMARSILARGASLNAKLADGRTPLAIALEKGHDELAELLKTHGAEA